MLTLLSGLRRLNFLLAAVVGGHATAGATAFMIFNCPVGAAPTPPPPPPPPPCVGGCWANCICCCCWNLNAKWRLFCSFLAVRSSKLLELCCCFVVADAEDIGTEDIGDCGTELALVELWLLLFVGCDNCACACRTHGSGSSSSLKV